MTDHLEEVHTDEHDPKYAMPYTPAIKVHGGRTVYLACVTAAPVYHSHPHVPEEFDAIPLDPGDQARAAVANMLKVLEATGGGPEHLVEVTRYIVDIQVNQDGVNRAFTEVLGAHRPASTTVEVTALATDPRLVVELKAVAVVPE